MSSRVCRIRGIPLTTYRLNSPAERPPDKNQLPAYCRAVCTSKTPSVPLGLLPAVGSGTARSAEAEAEEAPRCFRPVMSPFRDCDGLSLNSPRVMLCVFLCVKSKHLEMIDESGIWYRIPASGHSAAIMLLIRQDSSAI